MKHCTLLPSTHHHVPPYSLRKCLPCLLCHGLLIDTIYPFNNHTNTWSTPQHARPHPHTICTVHSPRHTTVTSLTPSCMGKRVVICTVSRPSTSGSHRGLHQTPTPSTSRRWTGRRNGAHPSANVTRKKLHPVSHTPVPRIWV